jgi:uncharacterized protein YndB with AHSA1/START domain
VIELRLRQSIARPPADVFRVLTDFERYLARWATGPSAARKLGSGPTGVGTRFAVTAKLGPLRFSALYEVLVWEPPARFAGWGAWPPARFEEEFHLAADDGTTALTQAFRVWPRGPLRILGWLLERQLRGVLAADLVRLQRLVEQLG